MEKYRFEERIPSDEIVKRELNTEQRDDKEYDEEEKAFDMNAMQSFT